MRINKTSDFAKLTETNKIDGYYYSLSHEDHSSKYRRSLLSFFNADTVDFVHVKTQGKDTLIITYEDERGMHKRLYKGQLKKKFFEIYYKKKQFFIPFIFSRIDVSRARIGKTKEGELLIRSFHDQSGNLLFFGSGSSKETPFRFSQAFGHTGLKPIQANGKWGFVDVSGNEKIACKYDYVSLFENGRARVKLNEKWGLIDTTECIITPFIYNKMSTLSVNGYEVSINNKSGMLNEDGKEFIPVIYDNIKHSGKDEIYIYLNKKVGRATRRGIFIPAIYTYLHQYQNGYYLGKKDGKDYLIDKDGYEYETEEKGNFITGKYLNPIVNTKRKILFEEQEIKE